MATTEEAFYEQCQDASVVGTLQAAYTDTGYLGPVSRVIMEREALIGVGICGIMENPQFLLNPDVLQKGAQIVRETNAAVAKAIGTNVAARTTCVKPDGSVALVFNTGSGIHPRHARRYFRRVQAARTEPIYQYFKNINPQMSEVYGMKADTTDVLTFPVVAPDSAIVRSDIDALTFLSYVKLVQDNWVVPGTAHEKYAPGLRHNVSNTVTVKPNEWDAVAEYIWEHRASFTGVSLLGSSGDKDYQQAPNEEVTTEDDIRKWNRLCPKPVDFTKMFEAEDVTDLKDSLACSGPLGCDVV
jgi:ribonucleoside-diphosphate reductase alpha chain